MGWHEDTVNKIGRHCSIKYGNNNVSIDASEKKTNTIYKKIGKNSLPILKEANTRNESLYSPDIVIENDKNKITHLVEVVESSPGTPVSVFGVVFTADLAISIMKKEGTQDPTIKPKLFFILPDPNTNNFDQYHCSICNIGTLHRKKFKNHLDWMEKDKQEIENIVNNINCMNKTFYCPICNKNHNIKNNHFTWLKLRNLENKQTKIIKENKLTRLFGKTLKNYHNKEYIKNKIKNIEYPIICYETNFDKYI